MRPTLQPFLKSLGLLSGIILAIMGMGGPDDAAEALKKTVDYFCIGTPYRAADWITAKGLLPLRTAFIGLGAGLFIWSAWSLIRTRTSARLAPRPGVGAPPTYDAALSRIEMWLGPTSTLSPENRLNEAYREFHRLADLADRGDQDAERLATIVAPWAREAARFYYASSEPYHRIERVILGRLARFQGSPATRRHVPPDDPTEIDRGVWELHFRPDSPTARKAITFLPSGQIGEGNNQNEATWTLRNGSLSVFRPNGSLQNEFIYVPTRRHFACTNSSDALGERNQIIRRR